MHFNIYVDNTLGQQLTTYAKEQGITRNRLIREALERFAQKERSTWPDEIMAFQGVTDFPAFELNRSELAPPAEDPFA